MSKRNAPSMRLLGAAVALSAGILLSGCANIAVSTTEYGYPKGTVTKLARSIPERELPSGLAMSMGLKGMDRGSPIMVRIYKEEDVLEVWKETRSGTFKLLKTYDICKFSGKLGPKKREGDRQAPEGFYTVGPAQLNPWSRNHLAFNMGFPNLFDRTLGRTGNSLMVHGGCTSIGCYAMTHKGIDEIYTLATDAFRGGQASFQVQAFPFRMTPENLAKHRNDPNFAFWKTLKQGADHFEVTGVPPTVGVCDRRYVFNTRGHLSATGRCPTAGVPILVAAAVARKEAADERTLEARIAQLEGKSSRTLFAAAPRDASSAAAFAPKPGRTPAQAALDEVFSTRW